jgi:hypothetical protein
VGGGLGRKNTYGKPPPGLHQNANPRVNEPMPMHTPGPGPTRQASVPEEACQNAAKTKFDRFLFCRGQPQPRPWRRERMLQTIHTAPLGLAPSYTLRPYTPAYLHLPTPAACIPAPHLVPVIADKQGVFRERLFFHSTGCLLRMFEHEHDVGDVLRREGA